MHIKRVFLPIRSSIPNEQEYAKLGGRSETLQKYAVWRRTNLFVASPSVLLSMILGFVDYGVNLKADVHGVMNGWGNFLGFMTEFADLVLLLAILCTAFLYDRILRSTHILRNGWIISIVFPFLPYIFPLEMMVSKWVVEQNTVDVLFNAKVQLALVYAIDMLPIIITIPGSALRACLKVRNLFPNSSLSGWILVIMSPFYSLVVLIAFVMVTQIAGTGLLLVGTVLLVCKPLVYMIWGTLFVDVHSPEVEKKIKILQNVSLGIGLLAIVMIFMWLVTADVGGVRPLGDCETCLLSYASGIRLLFEYVGRALVTTVVFCDFVVSMVLRDWEIAKKKNDELGPEDYVDYEDFYQVLGKQWTPRQKEEGDVEAVVEPKKETTNRSITAASVVEKNDVSSKVSSQQHENSARSSTKTITEMPDGTVKIKEETTNADGFKVVKETITKKK